MTSTKAVRVSLLPDAVRREAFAEASRFRGEFYECLTARRDELFELVDAVLCADGAVKSPVDLTLLPEHRRGHGAMYGGLNQGRIDFGRLRTVLAGLSLPRFGGGRLVLAVDVSPWLRSDAPCSADRLFCHVYGRAKTASQFIPGWPYSFVAVLEPGATSWTAILDAVRLEPVDDATAITAAQLRGVIERLVAAGQWQAGDPHIVIAHPRSEEASCPSARVPVHEPGRQDRLGSCTTVPARSVLCLRLCTADAGSYISSPPTRRPSLNSTNPQPSLPNPGEVQGTAK